MIPIQELLSRIRWDPAFGQGDFVIGYYDRVRDAITRVPLHELRFEPGDHYSFRFIDAAGEAHDIPLHRIREVYRNDELIWHRAAAERMRQSHEQTSLGRSIGASRA